MSASDSGPSSLSIATTTTTTTTSSGDDEDASSTSLACTSTEHCTSSEHCKQVRLVLDPGCWARYNIDRMRRHGDLMMERGGERYSVSLAPYRRPGEDGMDPQSKARADALAFLIDDSFRLSELSALVGLVTQSLHKLFGHVPPWMAVYMVIENIDRMPSELAQLLASNMGSFSRIFTLDMPRDADELLQELCESTFEMMQLYAHGLPSGSAKNTPLAGRMLGQRTLPVRALESMSANHANAGRMWYQSPSDYSRAARGEEVSADATTLSLCTFDDSPPPSPSRATTSASASSSLSLSSSVSIFVRDEPPHPDLDYVHAAKARQAGGTNRCSLKELQKRCTIL